MTKFVIGIGSQRAGSTLLYTILDQCSSLYMHPVKELHYFDTLFGVRHENVLRKFSANLLHRDLDKIIKAKDFSFIDRRYKNLLRANFLLATSKVQHFEYIELFRPCVHGHKMLGEITPEYMILPKEGIHKMREVVGDDAKIILLARNPVKRFVSAFKLLMHGIPNANTKKFEEEILAMLSNNSEWLRVQDALNDYELALNNYQEVFNHVLMLSYDELFGSVEKTAQKLSEFLEITLSLDDYKKIVNTKINALDETKSLSSATVSLLEARYAEKQAYLDSVFGKGLCAA
jgi:hypothetical protein